MDPIIRIKKHVPSGTIILNRPDKRNALSRALLQEIMQALEDFHLERKVRAVILAGAGDVFCSGMDLKEMKDTSLQSDSLLQWHRDAVLYRDLVQMMLMYPKPIIAAVNGPAIAGGAGLLLAADIVVAADTATFGLPEPKRGLVAGLVAPLLSFRAGAGKATQLLLTGRTMDAAESFRCGLFHELVKPDFVWARAHEIAVECALSAPEAVQMTKKMIYETIGESLTTMLAVGAAVSATARTTEAAAEGLAAFLEKRDPKWE